MEAHIPTDSIAWLLGQVPLVATTVIKTFVRILP